MDHDQHPYATHVQWTGNRGTGTARYAGYGRDHEIRIEGKPVLMGSADPRFRGDPARHNPEELLLAALSACHMLTYLALCARAGITVIAYEDRATAALEVRAEGAGRMRDVTLRPTVTLARAADAERAHALHEQAHAECFIANSCSIPIAHEPVIRS